MSRARMHGEDRKKAIVEAAMPLFARKGFAETTTKDLARAAGVSEPLLYKHFPSKEALYTEILAFSCQDSDPAVKRLNDLEPSTSTLVHLVYYLMQALLIGKPAGAVDWEVRHRLLLNSLLHDGEFARVVFRTRFDCFCKRIEECLSAAIKSGDAVKAPISDGNRARFAHHVGAWLALARLPEKTPINYKVSDQQLLNEAVWFVLRGMGLTDKALANYYKPKTLAVFFSQIGEKAR